MNKSNRNSGHWHMKFNLVYESTEGEVPRCDGALLFPILSFDAIALCCYLRRHAIDKNDWFSN